MLFKVFTISIRKSRVKLLEILSLDIFKESCLGKNIFYKL